MAELRLARDSGSPPSYLSLVTVLLDNPGFGARFGPNRAILPAGHADRLPQQTRKCSEMSIQSFHVKHNTNNLFYSVHHVVINICLNL